MREVQTLRKGTHRHGHGFTDSRSLTRRNRKGVSVWLSANFGLGMGLAKEKPAEEMRNESAICINYVCIFLVARLSTRQRRLIFGSRFSS